MSNWLDRGLCIDLDPRDFDNGGTDVAHNACTRCPVRAECLQDAHQSPDPVWGVYRAGRWWGAKPKGLEERLCVKCERPLSRVRNQNGILVYADRYCAACRRSMRPKVSLQTRIDQWNDYASQGIGLGRAAALMGIERHTLVGYRRDARRLGMTVLEPVSTGKTQAPSTRNRRDPQTFVDARPSVADKPAFNGVHTHRKGA